MYSKFKKENIFIHKNITYCKYSFSHVAVDSDSNILVEFRTPCFVILQYCLIKPRILYVIIYIGQHKGRVVLTGFIKNKLYLPIDGPGHNAYQENRLTSIIDGLYNYRKYADIKIVNSINQIFYMFVI